MIKLIKDFKGVPINVYWFAQSVRFSINSIYYQVPFKYSKFGYFRKSYFTLLIDLNQSEDLIYSKFKKNTSYEVRRSQKEGVITGLEIDKIKAVEFYNRFAATKSLNLLNSDHSNIASDHFFVTTASHNDKILVMHYYFRDIESGRVRLLYSATNVTENSIDVALIGRANRLLHYNDIILFKLNGYKTYDFGGYAFQTNEKSLLGINSFKESFGGELVKEYHYYSYWVYLFLKILNKI
jgi:hypothetical protein